MENEEQFYEKQGKNEKLRYREMIMHEQIWMLLSHKTEIEYADAEYVYIVFRILLDPAQLPIEEISKILEDYIFKYKENQGIEADEGETQSDDGIFPI